MGMVQQSVEKGADNRSLHDSRLDNGSIIIQPWIPVLTFCPFTNLPELVNIRIVFGDIFEVYAVRKAIKNIVRRKRKRMLEDIVLDIAENILEEYGMLVPDADLDSIDIVNIMGWTFGKRHVVEIMP